MDKAEVRGGAVLLPGVIPTRKSDFCRRSGRQSRARETRDWKRAELSFKKLRNDKER